MAALKSVVPSVLVVMALVYCSEPTASKPASIFYAWSGSYGESPIPTQVWGLDARQYRELAPIQVSDVFLSFVQANPGHLYIDGDEPDQQCITPEDYAVIYRDWSESIRAIDPTAKLSPAGFAEENQACNGPHSLEYATAFFWSYVNKYGEAPHVDEWRFHDFGLGLNGDLGMWWSRVESMADWSEAHGAPMVLGSWGFIDWETALVSEAKALIESDPRIVEAVWWSLTDTGYRHFLANPDGTLTPEGEAYRQ